MAPAKILQIVPAAGITAVYASGTKFGPRLTQLPLACWALVAEGGDDGAAAGTRVVGMEIAGMEVTFAGRTPDFLGYATAGESLERFMMKAREYLERESEQKGPQPEQKGLQPLKR